MARSSHLFVLFVAFIFGVSSATKAKAKFTSLFAPSANGKVPSKVCINVGSWFQTVGPFLAELGLVKYEAGEPGSFTNPPRSIRNTPHGHAFLTQRTKKNIKFKIKVDKRFNYVITLGFAEVQKKFCKKGARLLSLSVQSQKKTGIDVFDATGCNSAYFVQFKGIRASGKGMITVSVNSRKGGAVLAVLCAQRIGKGTGSGGPSTSPRPRPSKSSRPNPRPSGKPRPSRRPKPSSSSRPVPSSSPLPPPSSSPHPIPTLKPSTCQESGCINFEGPGDYVVIGNSMSVDEDRDDCTILSSSSAGLSVPAGATVKSALLYWSASGQITKNAEVNLNGIVVAAGNTYHGGSGVYQFYGAAADVTSLVQSSGTYSVSDIWYDNSGSLCTGNAAYAAWTLVVIYEQVGLPLARINVCYNDFTFTYPAGQYTNYVGCVAGNSGTQVAKTTVVSFESDAYKGENFYISGVLKGNGLFRGSRAPNLDILDFDLLSTVRSGVSTISYTFETYYTETVFGGAIEGLFLPVRVVYYTLH